MLETDPKTGCIKHIYIKPKFIETYMLEIDPRAYMKHMRKVITLIRILVYVLKTDSKRGCIQHIYKNLKNNLITHGNWEIKKKPVCHIKDKGHLRTYLKEMVKSIDISITVIF